MQRFHLNPHRSCRPNAPVSAYPSGSYPRTLGAPARALIPANWLCVIQGLKLYHTRGLSPGRQADEDSCHSNRIEIYRVGQF